MSEKCSRDVVGEQLAVQRLVGANLGGRGIQTFYFRRLDGWCTFCNTLCNPKKLSERDLKCESWGMRVPVNVIASLLRKQQQQPQEFA